MPWPQDTLDVFIPFCAVFGAREMKRNAFTLVELLTVLTIISLVAGMTAAAISSVSHTARLSRTRGIIAVIDDVLTSRFETYKTRPLSVSIPSTARIEISPRESARVRLNMIRDLMRMEMPDRRSDVMDGPALISGAVAPVTFNGSNFVEGSVVKRPVTWPSPAQRQVYLNRIPASGWTREFESAEALYLIVSTTFVDGLPAIESIPQSNIGDVDGDGMQEILDGWGTPIAFIRWPVDFANDSQNDSQNDLGIARTNDELDAFEVDFGFIASNTPAVATGLTRRAPFSIRPLVVSAGSDRVFDILFGYEDWNGTDVNDPNEGDIRFSQLTWPQTQMGSESDGHDPLYFYVDPYQRQAGTTTRLGGFLDEDNDGDEQRADNVTNFELESSI